ncbi:MAG: YceD family protein [Pseudomonadota bacterium]|nr:YceD family protein [Pseudomonadota bacterium]
MKRSAGSKGAGRFDALDLAARGEALAGDVDVSRRPRVADRLAPGTISAPIAWRIDGARDALDRPMLTVTVEGDLPLVCQRCLQPFDAPIAQHSELLLARDDDEFERLDAEELEVLQAAAPLDAMTLVEDEILLSLPFAPRHPEGLCPAGAAAGSGPDAAPAVKAITSPFARLAALRKATDRNT